MLSWCDSRLPSDRLLRGSEVRVRYRTTARTLEGRSMPGSDTRAWQMFSNTTEQDCCRWTAVCPEHSCVFPVQGIYKNNKKMNQLVSVPAKCCKPVKTPAGPVTLPMTDLQTAEASVDGTSKCVVAQATTRWTIVTSYSTTHMKHLLQKSWPMNALVSIWCTWWKGAAGNCFGKGRYSNLCVDVWQIQAFPAVTPCHCAESVTQHPTTELIRKNAWWSCFLHTSSSLSCCHIPIVIFMYFCHVSYSSWNCEPERRFTQSSKPKRCSQEEEFKLTMGMWFSGGWDTHKSVYTWPTYCPLQTSPRQASLLHRCCRILLSLPPGDQKQCRSSAAAMC